MLTQMCSDDFVMDSLYIDTMSIIIVEKYES